MENYRCYNRNNYPRGNNRPGPCQTNSIGSQCQGSNTGSQCQGNNTGSQCQGSNTGSQCQGNNTIMPRQTANSNNVCQKQTTGCFADNFSLAMAYVPFQSWNGLYNPDEAMREGTAFPELNLVFCGVRGNRR